MSHDSIGPWDGMDSRTHASVEGSHGPMGLRNRLRVTFVMIVSGFY